ncbi:MAG: ATP-binding cassette domain-containing protein [Gammaproteobacteria bacterium]|nr:ATP-binding cassette domain-containing protein [Gammaproteobacteria bacterium]MCH9744226.1 ATP-binding cassette domain-containing protein [Gammaproteobacteria bacterium]
MPDSLLCLNHVSYSPEGSERAIIDKVSFDIFANDFLIILGSNGSGKSTLFSLMRQLIRPSAGDILYQGIPVDQCSSKEYARDIMSLSQSPLDNLCISMTIEEHVRLYSMGLQSKLSSKNSILEYLETFNPKFPNYFKTPIRNFSGGEKQMLALALVLLREPKLLLLDEHTSALDPKTKHQLMEKTYRILKNRQVTCVMTTHELEQARHYGNRLLALRSGRVHREFSQEQKGLLSAHELLSTCYA